MNSNQNLHLKKLTVIVVTFNSAHCIPALSATLKYLPNVIFVDNASTDETCEVASTLIPNAKIIENKKNMGFGAANNLALSEVKTEFALLLNPDCVPESPFFEDLVAKAQYFPDAAMIAPQLLKKDGAPQIDYRWVSTGWISTGPAAEGACSVGFVCGAAILLNMPVMKEIGFFDEDYFLYYEDEDLCTRVIQNKKSIVLIPDVALKHLSRSSSKGKSPLKNEYIRGYHHAQSKLIYESKHGSNRKLNLLKWKTLMLAILVFGVRLLFPQPRYLARVFGRIRGLISYS